MANGFIIFLIILTTGVFTYSALRLTHIRERYIFEVDAILKRRQYYRLFSSGFLHANWWHFGFNMLTLFHLGHLPITGVAGLAELLLLYGGSMLAGSLAALYIHRNHGDYRAWGASGAVSGVVLAYVLHQPFASLQLLLLPIPFPAWVLGLVFVLVSLVSVRHSWGNIGHEAHLGGAVFGILLTVVLHPGTVAQHWWLVLAMLVPVALFVWLIVARPAYLIFPELKLWPQKWSVSGAKQRTEKAQFDHQRKLRKQLNRSPQEELDQLLEKVGKKGLQSLSKTERMRLDELSKRF